MAEVTALERQPYAPGEGDDSENQGRDRMNRSRSRAKLTEHLSRHISWLETSFRPKRIRLYSPPHQRQRWGETQSLPRVNYSDLFFDLYFVGATYQTSLIVGEDPSLTGMLYAAGTFFPLMGIWWERLWYDSRYVHDDDLIHRLGELAILVVLATAVLHIRSVTVMSDISGQVSMFAFSLSLLLDRVYAALRYSEVYFFGVGHREGLKGSVVRMMSPRILAFAGYLAATIVAGVAYFGGSGSDGEGRRLAEASGGDASAGHSNVPIWLCFVGYAASLAAYTIEIQFFFPKDGSHKETTVPMNIDFSIHRNGEWIMLMLGESVFSLLIVDVPNESNEFYTTFFCGMLTVILLQYLHFRSQPHHADDHALRRHKDAGVWWNNFNHLYSFFLVCLGADYTFFLNDFSSVPDAIERRLLPVDASRDLAGTAGDALYNAEDLRVPAANLYSASLAIIFFCLDVMTLLHLGVKESQNRCVCKGRKRYNLKGIVLIVMRIGVLVFTATLGLWMTDPANLAILGVVCVLIQILFRKLGGKYLSHSQVHALNPDMPEDDSDDDASWPNVTHARAIHEPSPEESKGV